MRRALDASLPDVSDRWAELAVPLIHGPRYRARWLARDELQTTDPFQLFAADPAVGSDRGLWTLVMVAAQRPSGEPSFVLLSHRTDYATHDWAAGEELLDHHCTALYAPPPA